MEATTVHPSRIPGTVEYNLALVQKARFHVGHFKLGNWMSIVDQINLGHVPTLAVRSITYPNTGITTWVVQMTWGYSKYVTTVAECSDHATASDVAEGIRQRASWKK